MLLQVFLLIPLLLLVNIDQCKLIFIKITRSGDAHGCQCNFLLVLLVSLLHVCLLFDPCLVLPFLNSDSLLKILPVNDVLHLPLVLQSGFLSLEINLVHLSQILEMLFLLSLLRFQILLICSHLGSEKLFTLDFLHFLEVVFSFLFESYGVDAGGLFLHAL